MRKLGIILTNNIMDRTLDEHIKFISEVGFDCTFTGSIRPYAISGEVGELIAKYGLECETLHAPFKDPGGRFNINHMWDREDTERAAYMLSLLMDSVDICLRNGAKISVVHLGSGREAPMPNDAGTERFTRLIEYADKKGVTIAFENQRRVGNLGLFLEMFEDCPHVGFCFDTGHEYGLSAGKKDYMGVFGQWLVCTHVNDNLGPNKGDLHMLPFDGIVNFEKVARDIKKSGYEGPLTLEVQRASTNFYDELSYEEYLIRAYERVSKLRALVDGE